MSHPWMPFYIADYLKDTGHLRTVEHGAYLLLIIQYWANGGLPDDERKLARVARLSAAEWEEARETLADLFEDGWRHKRVDAELAHAADVVSKRKAAAEVMHSNRRANAMQMHNSDDANAQHKHIQSPSPSQLQVQKEEDTPSLRSGARAKRAKIPLPDDYSPNSTTRTLATAKGLTEADLAETTASMREWALSNDAKKANWDAMHQGWVRREAKGRNQGRSYQNGQDKSAVAAARRLHERVREWSGETDGEIRPVLAITGK